MISTSISITMTNDDIITIIRVIIESDRRSDWSSCTVDVKKCLQKFQKHLVPIPQTPPSSK